MYGEFYRSRGHRVCHFDGFPWCSCWQPDWGRAIESATQSLSRRPLVSAQRFFWDCVRALAALEAFFPAVLLFMRPQPLRLGSLRHLWARHARQRRPQGRLVRRDCGFKGFSRFYCGFRQVLGASTGFRGFRGFKKILKQVLDAFR